MLAALKTSVLVIYLKFLTHNSDAQGPYKSSQGLEELFDVKLNH